MKIKTIMAAALAGAALSFSNTMSANDLMTPETLWSMHRLGSFNVSPQGNLIVYAVSTPDIEANKNRTAICLIKTDGTGRIQLTQGKESQVEPAFINEGERIAYLQGGNLWKMQKAFADYAAMDRPAECPEEKRKEIREGMQLFIAKYDALWY